MDTKEDINLGEEEFSIDMEIVKQNPSLPNGCEITSLTMVLNYLGYDVTKETMSDEYLPKAPVGKANYFNEFVGNPRDEDAYGCYAKPIVAAANAYLASVGSKYKAYDYTGSDFSDLLKKVKEGTPVIVWTAYHMDTDPYISAEWTVDGEYLPWKANMHCVVLRGYNGKTNRVSIVNPAGGFQSINMDTFIKRFKQFYSQAVVIE